MTLRASAIIVGLAGLLLLPTVGSADTRYDEGRYDPKDKLARGLAGMTTGFLELPGNIVAENREHGAAAAATIGFAKGLGMIPVREPSTSSTRMTPVSCTRLGFSAVRLATTSQSRSSLNHHECIAV